MSIIQDALKKAQSYLQQPDISPKFEQSNEVRGLKPGVMQPPKKAGTPPVRRKLRLIVPAILTVLAVLTFLVVNFIPKTVSRPEKAAAVRAQEVRYRPIAGDAAVSSGAAESAGTTGKMNAPELTLNGIMYIEGSPRALINNIIVGPGEPVDGATVKEINPQNVILEYENLEITLILK